MKRWTIAHVLIRVVWGMGVCGMALFLSKQNYDARIYQYMRDDKHVMAETVHR